MPSIVYEPISPEDEAAAIKALYRALRDNARLLRAMAAARQAQEDSVVKEQTINNSLSQTKEAVTR